MDISVLFASLTVNRLVLPNRFVLPGMQRGWCANGAPPPRLGEYYRRRVEGGMGLIITESVAVDHASATRNSLFARMTDQTLPDWKACVDMVKSAGGNILMQLLHEGAIRPEGGEDLYAAFPTLSPSGIAYRGRPNGRAATEEELASIRDAFVHSAQLAQRAGADGVEVHGAHGFLLDQFLWPVTNQRTDRYGGATVAERVLYPAEVVAAIRRACGPDFVISFRISQWKTTDYDARIVEQPEELEPLVGALKAAGVDMFHASTRRFWQPEWPGSALNLAGWIRKFSDLPVITVGSVGLSADVNETFQGVEAQNNVEQSVEQLARRVAAGEFDLISVGRSAIGDPDWVNKVRDGRFQDIRTFHSTDLGALDTSDSIVTEARKTAASPS